ncbi:hypothetical protein MCAMS1_00054 [biofilm metagenome]
MKKHLLPVFCIFHLCALLWWTIPHSFGNLMLASGMSSTFSRSLMEWATLTDSPNIARIFQFYINVTGSQQYWDFFAPHSVRLHQYLSVCEAITKTPGQEQVNCQGQPLFSNLERDLEHFQRVGGNRSRLYRLTENLIKLEDPKLLLAFTEYYRTFLHHNVPTAYLIAHKYELHPELRYLPKTGYRWDTLLITNP